MEGLLLKAYLLGSLVGKLSTLVEGILLKAYLLESLVGKLSTLVEGLLLKAYLLESLVGKLSTLVEGLLLKAYLLGSLVGKLSTLVEGILLKAYLLESLVGKLSTLVEGLLLKAYLLESVVGKLSTLVEGILLKAYLLESVVGKLEKSNLQLVTLVVEQRQEMRRLRDDVMAEGRRQNNDADVACVRAQGITLLVGNSMLQDVRLNKTDDGKQIKMRRKSGAIFTDIGEMINDIASDVAEINIVGGTQETMGNMDGSEVKENVSELVQKAKTVNLDQRN